MRVFVTMLGYNRPEMIRDAMVNLEETTTDAEHRSIVKALFPCEYPIPDAEANRQELHRLAREFGWVFKDIPNEGVMGNHNQVIHEFAHMGKDDFYVTFDPDVRMQQRGWISAMVAALRSDEQTVFCCAARPFHNEQWCVEQHGRTLSEVVVPDLRDSALDVKYRVARYQHLLAWSVGMWKGEWLASRARHFTADNPWYGYAEHADLRRMEDYGKKWCQVPDFYDHHLGAEPLYTEWKLLSAQKKVSAPFDAWLRSRA